MGWSRSDTHRRIVERKEGKEEGKEEGTQLIVGRPRNNPKNELRPLCALARPPFSLGFFIYPHHHIRFVSAKTIVWC